ncbi:MAG: GAF domain-containing sensor histidine kinase [Chloroflexi bacterium]|nr:GAF domain-containing sensor histidine kinase [Chloroflexota bacterium]
MSAPDTSAISQLQRRIAILTRIVEISAALNSQVKLKPLLGMIMEAAVEIVDAEAASVLLWDTKTNELRFAATTTGDNSDPMIGLPVPLEGSIAGAVLNENRAMMVNDVHRDRRHYPGVDRVTEFQTRSVLGVPMRAKTRVIGVLEAVNKRTLPWSEDDAHNLALLAAQAAVALESAQLVSALQKANEELNRLDKLKSDFIAIASHELRTPLGVILGYSSFLQDTPDTQVRDHADKVVASALQLRRIIEDLTNLRYMEQKSGDLKMTPMPLAQFLQEVVHDALGLIEAKQHRLQYVPPASDIAIQIDHARMMLAVTNILNNAIRFTPEGGRIVIQTKVQGGRQVWILVTDTGIGLAKEELERIFDRFYQVEHHMTRTQGGMGIGLSIAKAVVEAHGGRIWASSPGLNQGTTFTIALPLAR